MLARLFDAAVESYQAALDLHIDDALAGKKLDEATKKRDEADRKKREKEEEIARMAEEARKKKEELERKRLEEESKRKGIDDDLARKRAEAEERERLYREKMRLENEKRQEEIRKKIEAQKQALAMADKFRLQREQQVRDAQKQTGSSENLSRFELADKYPQGVTQEEIDGPNCVITRVVIVNGKVGDEYRKIKYNWGQTAYKKNDKDISEAMFKKETGR
jgi:flagellar biosynthesis GTPase FlhF